MNLERTHGLPGLAILVVAFAMSGRGIVSAEEPAETTGKPGPTEATVAGSAQLARLLKEASLSPGVSEVARMAQLGTDSSVLTAHVESLDMLRRLRTEDVEHLQEHGVPDVVIATMIRRGATLRNEAASRPVPPVPPPTPAPTAPTVVYVPPFSSPNVTPPSTVTVIGRSDARRGLSFRRYYYSPRSYYASYRASGSRYASYGGHYGTYPDCLSGYPVHRGKGQRVCR